MSIESSALLLAALLVLVILCACRVAARADAVSGMPTARQIKRWRRERYDLNPALRK